MPNTYVIIGVLLLLLAGAGYAAYTQTKEVGRLNEKVTSLEDTISTMSKAVEANKQKASDYYQELQRLEEDALRSRQRAAKDLTRVTAIAEKRATLYVKLVNEDYEKLLAELEKVSK
ncbi:hypothetical protein AVV29_gp051 [Vibrio phage phi 3]|uniref:Uncharacterized protein n=1 Tax=Vibrio phage phi 3 TaxID=1589298 RepID=A0A0B5HAP8_9CAUD|nr:hypothetical protein AVV29_gp051 [Vibrio phage phi 3]AJF40819.1 hypothetical protein SBVP3_0051 [Vibrio phage phi 3]